MSDSAARPSPPAVELRGITKRFPGVIANQDVNLRVEKGEIHAVVGENGAGKSTLMKILYGMLRPDAGTISIDGRAVAFKSPHDAIDAGVGMVHQHFMLADNLTVLENVILGNEPSRLGRIDGDAAKERIAELGRSYGLPVEADRRVEELGVGARQRVEILKVLFRGARILILDEPTAVLVPQEVSELFANLEELKREGLTTIFISHKLNEVLAVADRITVIRAGSTVTTVEPAATTARQLAQLMVGSDLPTPETRESTVTDQVVLGAEHLTVRAPDGRVVLDDCSFAVHAGEIVGVAGVEGNGQTELIDALMGLAADIQGTVHLGDDDITYWSTRRRREHGLGYVPEDRQRDGLLLGAPCWENDVLGHQTEPTFSRGPWIDRIRARRHARKVVTDFDVRTPSIDVTVNALSGGNQQKLIMGRELTVSPRALIAAHPTRGVDVGAQAAIWDHLRNARRNGLAVLLVSADLEELIGLSDSLLVLFRGGIVARLDPATVTPESLGAYMTGTTPDAGGMKLNRIGLAIVAPALALLISLAVAVLVLQISGSNLGEVWSLIVDKGFTLRSLLLTLNRAVPYYISGVAVAVGFKMNLFNIGVEGQYRLAALLAAAAGAAIALPAPLHLVLIFVVAMAVGGGWALIAGVLRVTRGVSEVISTIMLNAISFGLTAFMLTRWFQAAKTGTTDYTVGTKPIASSGHLPHLDHIVTGLGFTMPRGVQLQSFIVIAVIVGVVYWLLVWRTRLGFDLRASGLSPAAARASGVSARRMVLIAMGISGAFAGLIGLNGILSEAPFRYTDDAVTAGLGFTGIAIALLGRNHPVGIAFGAMLWAFMDVLRTPLAEADLPNEIVSILQGTVVLSVVIAYELVRRVGERREAAALARESRGGIEPAPAGAAA